MESVTEAFSERRQRRPDSLAESVGAIVDQFGVPISSAALRVLLADRGRPTTAEQLGRLAAYERQDFGRTRLSPRLAAVIDEGGEPITPRWWRRGDWRLARCVMSDESRALWLARVAERLCLELSSRPDPPRDLVTLTLGTVARLEISHDSELPLSFDDWIELRSLILDAHGAVANFEVIETQTQVDAAARMTTQLNGEERYFGRRALAQT